MKERERERIIPLLFFCSHFSLLVNHSNLPNSHVAMNHILIYIKQKLFMLSAEENAVRGVGLQILMFELFESTNFGVCLKI